MRGFATSRGRRLTLLALSCLTAAAPAAAREDSDYPSGRETLVAWLGARTNISPGTVVSVTPELVVAIVGKTMPPTPGGPVRLTLREEVIDANYVPKVGGRSSLMSMDIQCEERRVRMDERRLYAGPNLTGSVERTEPSASWVRIPEDSIMDDVARAACDTGYSWPLQVAAIPATTVMAAAAVVAPPAPPPPEPAPPAPVAEPEQVAPIAEPPPAPVVEEIPPAPPLEEQVMAAVEPPAVELEEPPAPPLEEQVTAVAEPQPVPVEPPVAPVEEDIAPPPQSPLPAVETPAEAVSPPEPVPPPVVEAEPAEPASVTPEAEAPETVNEPAVESNRALQPEVPTQAAPGPPAGPIFAVQIGAYRSVERAEEAWQALRLNRPILVEGLSFETRPIRVEGRVLLRGLIRDFASPEAAASFCSALAGTGYGCILRPLAD